MLEAWINTQDIVVRNACNGTLGDLYTTNIWIWFVLFNLNVAHATSMLLYVNVRV